MEVKVKVYPHSRRVRLVFDDVLNIYLTEPAESNKANRQLLDVLRRKFNCSASLKRGFKGRRKVVELDIEEEEFSEIKKAVINAQSA